MLGQLLFTAVAFQLAFAKQGFGPTDQEWGHVAVREKANMFWWLHYTTADVNRYTDRPLIIWLQGGPGGSSTGFGNFAELGPLDLNLKPRNTTWVQWANVMFVDNPAGVGFGNVDDNSQFVVNNAEIAQDFLVFLKQFYETLPKFKGVPLYIFSESYGGKMTAEIALVVDQARKNGDIEANLKGIGLGDSWVSPIDSILSYAPYLLSVGILDQDGYKNVMQIANQLKTALDANDLEKASNLYSWVPAFIQSNTNGVDEYNILTKIASNSFIKKNKFGSQRYGDALDDIMNMKVKPALNISQHWVNENEDIFTSLSLDFLNPVTKVVERLLNETDIKVAVYNGQLDLIVNTPGTIHWVENLNFKDKDLWDAASRSGFVVDGYYEGYVRKYGNFAFYWVDRAGHMVPMDNPSAMYYILKDVTNDFEV